jgi:hypothetical protein
MATVQTLTQMTARDAQILYVLFVMCRDEQPRQPGDIAARFKSASTQMITSVLYKLRDVGAARFDSLADRPGWKPTVEGIDAMRVYYNDWSQSISSDDERKALGA